MIFCLLNSFRDLFLNFLSASEFFDFISRLSKTSFQILFLLLKLYNLVKLDCSWDNLLKLGHWAVITWCIGDETQELEVMFEVLS